MTFRSNVESKKAEVAHKNEAFEAYKDQYRVLVRGQAKGEFMETPTTYAISYKFVFVDGRSKTFKVELDPEDVSARSLVDGRGAPIWSSGCYIS